MGEYQPPFTSEDVQIEQERSLFQGFFQVKGLRLQHRRFAGGWTSPMERELFVRDDATCVLPWDPVRRELVLIEQFRAGALGRDQSPWLLELVAGINEPGETPQAVAHREAKEEADLTLQALAPICQYLASPGGSNELVHLFCARVDASTAGGLHGLAEENEDIRVSVWSLEAALTALENGTINNAPAIIALQWLALNEAALAKRWGVP
ncbi:MAG: NUDIX domain-containing protein [Halomonadaceae bacterium]|nr:MAG: NUDIX domain-containing protein [Halomonadaceae bacterium]